MSDRPNFSLSDLKKLYATKSSPENAIKLCYSQKEVFVKPLKIKDKKEILKSIESKNETVINRALDEVIEKYAEYADGSAFSVNTLTSQERFQLLVHIRVSAAGTTAKIAHECPACGHINKEITYDLNSMYVKNYVKPEGGDELTLSNGNIKLLLGPMTRDKEIEIERYIKKNKLTATSEKNFALMAGVIKSITMKQDDIEANVTLSTDEMIEFFENLPAVELDKILDYFKHTDFGVKMPFEFKCEKCNHEEEQEVNIAVFFIS
jgi:hypothetical protein